MVFGDKTIARQVGGLGGIVLTHQSIGDDHNDFFQWLFIDLHAYVHTPLQCFTNRYRHLFKPQVANEYVASGITEGQDKPASCIRVAATSGMYRIHCSIGERLAGLLIHHHSGEYRQHTVGVSRIFSTQHEFVAINDLIGNPGMVKQTVEQFLYRSDFSTNIANGIKRRNKFRGNGNIHFVLTRYPRDKRIKPCVLTKGKTRSGKEQEYDSGAE